MYPNNNETGTQSKKPIPNSTGSFKTINQTPNTIMIDKKIHIINSLILFSNFNFFILLNFPQSSYLSPNHSVNKFSNHSSKDLPCVFFLVLIVSDCYVLFCFSIILIRNIH